MANKSSHIKIPTARQLPSGKWCVQLRIDGRSITITRDKEDQAIAEALAVKKGIMKAKAAKPKKKVTEAIDDYISCRSNVLSPATVRGYRFIQRGRFQTMMQRDIGAVTQEQWQRAVNAEAKLCSAKTLQNAWRFLSSVIVEATGEKITVRLPQVKPNEHPFLTPDQIPAFVEAIHGMPVEIPALLALSSMRRSELLDLRWENVDLENGIITVSGAAVYGEGGVLVRKKENKNRTSTRLIPIIPPLRAALEAAQRKSDYVVTMSPAGMFQQINRICEANNLPKVGIHGLRHSFASLAYHLNVPEKVAMEIGGWANDQTMRKIYTHIAQQDVAAHAKTFTAFFDNKNDNANKNANENEKVTDIQ